MSVVAIASAKTAVTDLANFLGSVGKIFSGKLIYGLKKEEVERILVDFHQFRRAVGLTGGSSPPYPRDGSLLKAEPGLIPVDLADKRRAGNWVYAQFGFRNTAFEPGLSNIGGWFSFDPTTLTEDTVTTLLDDGKVHVIPASEKKRLAQLLLEKWDHPENPRVNDKSIVDAFSFDDSLFDFNKLTSNASIALAKPNMQLLIGFVLIGGVMLLILRPQKKKR